MIVPGSAIIVKNEFDEMVIRVKLGPGEFRNDPRMAHADIGQQHEYIEWRESLDFCVDKSDYFSPNNARDRLVFASMVEAMNATGVVWDNPVNHPSDNVRWVGITRADLWEQRQQLQQQTAN